MAEKETAGAVEKATAARAAEARQTAAIISSTYYIGTLHHQWSKKRVSHQLIHPRTHRLRIYRYRCILLHAEHTRTCNTHEMKVAPSVRSHGVV